MEIAVRHAMAGDDAVIAAYNAAMALETEHLELDRARLLEGVRSVLADPSKGFYLLAESVGKVAGQMMITFEWSDWRNGVFWWIQSVYVDPEWRRMGVFRNLYEYAFDEARRRGNVCGIRLYVEGENAGAQRTYESLGMKKAAYQMYEVDFVIRR